MALPLVILKDLCQSSEPGSCQAAALTTLYSSSRTFLFATATFCRKTQTFIFLTLTSLPHWLERLSWFFLPKALALSIFISLLLLTQDLSCVVALTHSWGNHPRVRKLLSKSTFLVFKM